MILSYLVQSLPQDVTHFRERPKSQPKAAQEDDVYGGDAKVSLAPGQNGPFPAVCSCGFMELHL